MFYMQFEVQLTFLNGEHCPHKPIKNRNDKHCATLSTLSCYWNLEKPHILFVINALLKSFSDIQRTILE